MNQDQIFKDLSPTRLFFRCAVPNMVSMAMVSLYVIIDGIFVGKFIGPDALAAINLVMPFLMISFALADMVAIGSSVQIAMRLGQGKEEEAGRIFSFCTLLIIGISCLVGAIGFFAAEPILRMIGAEAHLVALGASYMKIYAVCAPGVMIFFAIDNYLRICGKVTYSMVMNVLMSVLNIALDWFCIVHLKMGIAGAAWASCIAIFLGSLVGFYPFFRGKLSLRLRAPRLSLRLLGNILANGSSEFFANIATSITMVIINAVLLRLAGGMGVAAFSIVMYIDTIVAALIFGMADSLQPALSYNYGAGERARVIAIEKRLLLGAAIISISTMLFMIFGGQYLVPLFIEGEQPELLAMSTRAMLLFSFSYLFGWFGTVTSAFFTALNKPVYSLILAFGQSLVLPLCFVLILPGLIGIDGVWLTTVLTKGCAAVLAAAFLLHLWRGARREMQAEIA